MFATRHARVGTESPWAWAWGVVASLLLTPLVGCNHVAIEPQLVYEGNREAPRVSGGSLPHLDALAKGDELLGTVTASCTRERPSESLAAITLGNLDCHSSRLARVVEEQAVLVGGTALHRFACDRAGERLECSANVVSDGRGPHRASFFARQRALLSARIEFRAVGGVPAGEPWPVATEQTFLSVAERKLGTLAVSMPSRAEFEDVRLALFDAAAALGAAHVIAPICRLDADGQTRSCAAEISAPRLDPRRNPSAR